MARNYFPALTEAERESVVRESAHRFRMEGDLDAATVLEAALAAWNDLLAEEGALV